MTDKELKRLSRQNLLRLLLLQAQENESALQQLSDTKAELTVSEETCDRLKGRLDEKDEQIEVLKVKLNDKDFQMEHLKQKLNEKDEVIEKLKAKLDAKDKQIEKLSEALKSQLGGDDSSIYFIK